MAIHIHVVPAILKPRKTKDAKVARELAEEINALRAKAGLPAKSFPGTSTMALQVILNQAQRGDFGKTNDAASDPQFDQLASQRNQLMQEMRPLIARKGELFEEWKRKGRPTSRSPEEVKLNKRLDQMGERIIDLFIEMRKLNPQKAAKQPVWTGDAAPTEIGYHTYQGWKTTCKTKNPQVRFDDDKDICSALPAVGEWDGEKGVIYS